MWRFASILLVIWGVLGCAPGFDAQAQSHGVHMESYVNTDSVSIGHRLIYSVVIYRPDSLQLFFPSSLERTFLPLTLIKTHVAPSKPILDKMVKDSVAYELTLLDRLDSVTLQVPVYAWVAPDTLRFLPPVRVLHFRSLLPAGAQIDTLSLRMQVHMPALPYQPLYLWWGIGGLLALLVLWRLLVPLRRYLMKLWLLYQWDKRWRDYEDRVFEQGRKAIQLEDAAGMEQARRQWLEFMEVLRGQPLKSLTSPELAALWQDKSLKQALGCVDRAVYGGHFEEGLPEAWTALHHLAAREYEQLIDKLKKDKNAVKAVRFSLHR